jgi:hypothetical protein
VNNYSAEATLRSIEDSLNRLQTDHVEIVWVHDVARDFYGDQWLEVFETARSGAFRQLDRMRDEGVIKAWGLGVNRVKPIELLLELDEPRPDGSLLAGRYSLLDHDWRSAATDADGRRARIGHRRGRWAWKETPEYLSASPTCRSRIPRRVAAHLGEAKTAWLDTKQRQRDCSCHDRL